MQETTVQQDMLFLELVRNAGIDGLTMEPEEPPEEFAERLLGALVADGNVLKLLGCLLVPPAIVPRRGVRRILRAPGETPRAWSPELCEETASYLGTLTSPEDKAKVRNLVLTLLAHFFESGIVSLWTTETSSDEEGIPTTEEHRSHSATATGRGPRSSSSSQTETPTPPTG